MAFQMCSPPFLLCFRFYLRTYLKRSKLHFKHLEVRQKYSVAFIQRVKRRRLHLQATYAVFSTLLSVFDISLNIDTRVILMSTTRSK